MALNPMTSVLIRDRRKDTGEGGESPAKMEAEMGVMQPQARECLEPPEAGRGMEWNLP